MEVIQVYQIVSNTLESMESEREKWREVIPVHSWFLQLLEAIPEVKQHIEDSYILPVDSKK